MHFPTNSIDDKQLLKASSNVKQIRENEPMAWVEVNLASIVQNLVTIRSAAEAADILAVVKANAYGLGAVEVAKSLEQHDVWGFAVATLEEAIELRDKGIQKPILVLRPAEPDSLMHYAFYEIRPVLEHVPPTFDPGIPFHIEVDTGMGRTGIRWDEKRSLTRLGKSKPEGVFTHFHSADEDVQSVERQYTRFLDALKAMRYQPRLLHAANSAATWRLRHKLNLVRPGIFLFGGTPAADLTPPEPVVRLQARIISIRYIRKGESVSYGATWRAKTDTRIATLAIGYADGVPRTLQAGAHVLIAGQECPVVGRVTMDMMMVELGAELCSAAKPGDVATLIGDEGERTIGLSQFAAWSSTIEYEVLTRLGSRLPRVYLTD
jgi:alanine racemase